MWKVDGSGDWAATTGEVADGHCLSSKDRAEITHVYSIWITERCEGKGGILMRVAVMAQPTEIRQS